MCGATKAAVDGKVPHHVRVALAIPARPIEELAVCPSSPPPARLLLIGVVRPSVKAITGMVLCLSLLNLVTLIKLECCWEHLLHFF
jgi:hypothetical protein